MSLIPSSRRGTLGRFAAGALIVILFTATATAVAGLLQFKQLATDIGGTAPLRHAQVVIPEPGQPQTILILGSDHRGGRAAERGQLGHDHPRPAERELADDQRDLGAARPEGRGAAPRRQFRDREDQRGLPCRRAEPRREDPAEGRLSEAPGQPHRRHQLRGLRGARQRDRLRLHRRRPPLLQPEHRHGRDELLEHRHPGRLPEAVRRGRARIRPLPAHRHRHRALRAPAGLHPRGQGPVRRRPG